MNIERLEAVVSGRVQGDLYRNYLCRKAKELRLVGELKNLPQKKLWISAEGPPDILENFLQDIQKPPLFTFAHVADTDYTWHIPSGRYHQFTAIFDG